MRIFLFSLLFLVVFILVGTLPLTFPYLYRFLFSNADEKTLIAWNDSYSNEAGYLALFIYVFALCWGLGYYSEGKKKVAYVLFIIATLCVFFSTAKYAYLDDEGYHYKRLVSFKESDISWKEINEVSFVPFIQDDARGRGNDGLNILIYLKSKDEEHEFLIDYYQDSRLIHLKEKIWKEEHVDIVFYPFGREEMQYAKNNEVIEKLYDINDWEEVTDDTMILRSTTFQKELDHYLSFAQAWSEDEKIIEAFSKIGEEETKEGTERVIEKELKPAFNTYIKELKAYTPRTKKLEEYQKIDIEYRELSNELYLLTYNENAEKRKSEIKNKMEFLEAQLEK